MAEPAPHERLADRVEARVTELGMTWQDVRAAGGPGIRTLSDLRHGRWASFRPATLRKLDTALRWVPGTAQACLDGREPPPLNGAEPALPAADWRPEALAAGYGVSEILAAEKLRPDILRRLRSLGATPPDQAGELLFPGDARSAAAWDAGWSASAEDPAARAEQVALIVALQQVRRASAVRGSRGA